MMPISLGKTEYAYQMIKQKICEGIIPPLSDIVDDVLQRELNISRTPIREAIQRLDKERFVKIYPRKGTIVTEVTKELIEEVFQVRELNEPYIAKFACRSISSEWLENMYNNFVSPPSDLNEEELRRYFIQCDKELHAKIIEHCGNRFINNILTIVYDHLQRIRIKISNPIHKNKDNSVSEHILIIEALINKNEDKIEQILLEHIRNARRLALHGYP